MIEKTPQYEAGEWVPNNHSGHSRKVGTIELLKAETFHHPGQHAADDDWIYCEPQAVDILQHGDTYWICASFSGKLTQTTRTYQVTIGQEEKAHMQTQSFGGIGHWLENKNLRVTITHPGLSIQEKCKYADGRPILALLPIPTPRPIYCPNCGVLAGLSNA